ncbi:MAG: site-2 protease family protein [Candidatus Woykebacteria bacterium]
MTIVLAIIFGILLLGFLIFVHEAGHFFSAKFFNVKVEEFGFGFPPRIWGKKKGETIYSINAIPAGGFVRLFGEDGDKTNQPRSFSAKGPWVRAAIIVAGVVMNLLIAFLLFTALLASNGFRTDIPLSIPTSGQTLNIDFPFGQQENKAMVSFIFADSPAEKSRLQSLDEVIAVNGEDVSSIAQLQQIVKTSEGEELDFQVYNLLDRSTRNVEVIPEKNSEGDVVIGVSLDAVKQIRYSRPLDKIFVGPFHSTNMLIYQGTAVWSLFSKAFEEGSAQPVTTTVSGPVGIAALLGTFVGVTGIRGVWVLVETIALISLILAVINVLPIPALDGGRLFFSVIEGLTGKKVNPNIERLIHTTGFAVLIVLFLLITYNDISKFFS